jgi:type II secretory pathway pseudopilin PulG
MIRNTSRQPPRNRDGFSLIEVILATAVLLGSVMVLSELAGIGRRQGQRARDLTRAQLLCERQLSALLTEGQPITPVQQIPIQATATRPSPLNNPDPTLPGGPPDDPLGTRHRLSTPDPSSAHDMDDRARTKRTAADTEWQYSVAVTPLPNIAGMSALTVTVSQSQHRPRRPVTFRLTRWIATQALADGQPIHDPLETAAGQRFGRTALTH